MAESLNKNHTKCMLISTYLSIIVRAVFIQLNQEKQWNNY